MLPDLQAFLAYRHPQVIRSYIRDFPAYESRAEVLFADMLRFLWLSRKHMEDRERKPDDMALDFLFVMHEEMRDIDNMWHNFILYTKDYTDFCLENFGEYLHHKPDVAETIVQTESEFSTEMQKFLSYVYDELGEQTMRRWFAIHFS